jgi:hypothetical protein
MKKRPDLDKNSKWYDFDYLESKEGLTLPKDIREQSLVKIEQNNKEKEK